jgi:hypothetical protein
VSTATRTPPPPDAAARGRATAAANRRAERARQRERVRAELQRVRQETEAAFRAWEQANAHACRATTLADMEERFDASDRAYDRYQHRRAERRRLERALG